jgi:hypothetical protein
MTDRDLMHQALDALEFIPSCGSIIGHVAEMKQVAAVSALRDRLAQPEKEPVAWANRGDLQNFDMRVRTNGDPMHTVPLYAHPPQRQWVGLTDDDYETLSQYAFVEVIEKVEALLKEKNSG